MNRTIRRRFRPSTRRRGVTLVEMLVTVAVLVIIMTILVQVFQAATGALSAAQKLQQIDDQFRRLDSVIKSDLEGVTARFTPPLDPSQNQGYFEYGENEFADLQGEDSDDYIRFTAKAPDGRPFTGRMWVTGGPATNALVNLNVQPVTISSEYAEIIYFLRNGNLYRRVLLVAPQLQPTIVQAVNNLVGSTGFYPGVFGNSYPNTLNIPVSWQGVNDLSARPSASGNGTNNENFGQNTIVLNSLGDLTNRENRFASPRFANDYWNATAATPGPGQDNIPDDLNGDNVPDSYPSLYYGVFNPTNGNVTGNWQLTFEPPYSNNPRQGNHFTTMAFPYVFPGAYSVPQTMSTAARTSLYGWIHSPSPTANVPTGGASGTEWQNFDTNPLAYLQSMNHNPIDVGDNLPTPNNPPPSGSLANQTWWGFPTWRETLSANWNDPTVQVNVLTNATANLFQPTGLVPRPNNTTSIANDGYELPWMGPPLTVAEGGSWPNGIDYSIVRPNPVPRAFSDASGYKTMSLFLQQGNNTGTVDPAWYYSWEDDLIMTGVRSFDVKAYDNALAGFADLGWGDDVRFAGVYSTTVPAVLNPPSAAGNFLFGNLDYSGNTPAIYPPQISIQGTFFDYINYTFAHEGRMPPLVEDNRLDAQNPNPSYVKYSTTPSYLPYSADYPNYTSNIGDDSQGIVRLRRVWDSWSTEYTKAPASGVNNATGFPVGPLVGTPPVYPSYPPPYPAPLRGIQIQIRAVDPTNQRIKSLTIRQDFSDKL